MFENELELIVDQLDNEIGLNFTTIDDDGFEVVNKTSSTTISLTQPITVNIMSTENNTTTTTTTTAPSKMDVARSIYTNMNAGQYRARRCDVIKAFMANGLGKAYANTAYQTIFSKDNNIKPVAPVVTDTAPVTTDPVANVDTTDAATTTDVDTTDVDVDIDEEVAA